MQNMAVTVTARQRRPSAGDNGGSVATMLRSGSPK
jgi:hypothetical protein